MPNLTPHVAVPPITHPTPKYRFTGVFFDISTPGPSSREVRVYQIEGVMPGRPVLGGYIEHERNLSHAGRCWIDSNAAVYGLARVRVNARISGVARIGGSALVSDDAEVGGSTVLSGSVIVGGQVQMNFGNYNYGMFYSLDPDGQPENSAPSSYDPPDDDDDYSDDDEIRGSASTERTMSLLNYSANPFDHFPWHENNKPNALVFGVELEMEPTYGNTHMDILEALGGSVGKNYILKSDGSLSDGVELVTMPFTLEQHRKGVGVNWREVLDKVKGIAMSGAGTDRCGIHIHINKKALSALTIGKMLVFLNSPHLAQLVTTIAQRPSGSFCQRDSKKKITDGIGKSASRYDIMNVSVRHPTCELRMFKGNVAYERVIKNIEFCHALVQYCRQSSAADLADWGAFTRWLVKERGMYPNLVQFLIDKNVAGVKQLYKARQDSHVSISDI